VSIKPCIFRGHPKTGIGLPPIRPKGGREGGIRQSPLNTLFFPYCTWEVGVNGFRPQASGFCGQVLESFPIC
jgi:hypothetical protein